MKIPDDIPENCPIIYILGNKCMKNYFKIGKTIKNNLYLRVKDLSSKTSVPISFDLLGIIIDKYGNGYDLEKRIFEHFNAYRINRNREFFFFENSDELLQRENICNKKIIWNDVNRINYSNSLAEKAILKHENRYIEVLQRRERIINDLFARRHSKEIRTNFTTPTKQISEQPINKNLFTKLKSLLHLL
jgi:hypothetical protein